MPQPPAVDAIRQELLDLYAQSWADIEAQLANLLMVSPARTPVLRRRLAEIATDISHTMGDLDVEARRWLQDRLPVIYELAGTDAARAVGENFRWGQHHAAAVQHLATRTYSDLLSATRFVRQDTKRFVRQAAAAGVRRSIIGGDTAQQAGRDLAKQLRTVFGADPIAAVRYSNGARHSLADYADTVLRTVTATTFNAGTLNTGIESGVQWVEIFDGPDCGWTTHDDPDKANGSVRTMDDALGNPIAHPRCSRGFGLRPDVTSVEQAKTADRFTPEERAAAAADERARAAGQPARFARRTSMGSPQDRRQKIIENRATRAARAKPAAQPNAPVSAALNIQARGATRDAVQHAVDLIDQVHGDGVLTAIPVDQSRSQRLLGAYHFQPGGPPAKIVVSSLGDHPLLTTAHEVGHFLDHQAIGARPGFFASLSAASPLPDVPELAAWRTAIDESQAVRSLRALRSTTEARVDTRFRDYLLRTEELWARSYAQYVATRSGDTRILAELDMVRRPSTGPVTYARQWGDGDFEPVAQAIDLLFQRLGWRR